MNYTDYQKFEKAFISIADDAHNIHMQEMPNVLKIKIAIDGKHYYLRIRDAIGNNLPKDLEDVLQEDANKCNRDIPSMLRYIVEQYYKDKK